ncbi:NUDIX hydrolase [Amycolatopsis sp. WAC 04182]|uniref:NUDIX hydrolase n=1 Tax=Amycolatopsis sp. WAC 04182 TaxID=2203198 RepID=UPI000F795C6A|nr:NUDIX domain-containing protein [Amycolatopsis sp. WAC 04182]RSN52672.1 NUDIX hydrolase [Amycolatopsis sp. WAC 04182]
MAVAVDLAILTVRDKQLQVLTVERGTPPFQGACALPGGYVEDEDLSAAAARELQEETGLDADKLHIEQFGAYGAPDRDPRGRVVSIAYLALMPDLPLPSAGGDARSAHWIPVGKLLAEPERLAFDHHQILTDAVERARAKLEDTTLAPAFCPDEFTVAELREVYETVWGHALHPGNFRRKVTGAEDFLIPTGERTIRSGGRAAALYRRGPAERLIPAILRHHSARSGAGRSQLRGPAR